MAKIKPELWMSAKELNNPYEDDEVEVEEGRAGAGPVERKLSKGRAGRRLDPGAAKREAQRAAVRELGLNMDFNNEASVAGRTVTRSAPRNGIIVERIATPKIVPITGDVTAYKLEQKAVWAEDGTHFEDDIYSYNEDGLPFEDPEKKIPMYKKDPRAQDGIARDDNGKPIVVAIKYNKIKVPHKAGDIAEDSEFNKPDPIILREADNNSNYSVEDRAHAWSYAIGSDSQTVPDFQVTEPAILEHWDEIEEKRRRQQAKEDIENLKAEAAARAADEDEKWIDEELTKRWDEASSKQAFKDLGNKLNNVVRYAYAIKHEVPQGERIPFNTVRSEINELLRYGIDGIKATGNHNGQKVKDARIAELKPFLVQAAQTLYPEMSDEDAERLVNAGRTYKESDLLRAKVAALRQNMEKIGMSDEDINKALLDYTDLGHDKFGTYALRGLGMNAFNATQHLHPVDFESEPIYKMDQWPTEKNGLYNKIKNAAGDEIDEWTYDTDDNGDGFFVRHSVKMEPEYRKEKVRRRKMKDVPVDMNADELGIEAFKLASDNEAKFEIAKSNLDVVRNKCVKAYNELSGLIDKRNAASDRWDAKSAVILDKKIEKKRAELKDYEEQRAPLLQTVKDAEAAYNDALKAAELIEPDRITRMKAISKANYDIAYDSEGKPIKGKKKGKEPVKWKGKDGKDHYTYEEVEEERPVFDYSFNNDIIDYFNRRDETESVPIYDDDTHKTVKERYEGADDKMHNVTLKEEKEKYYVPALKAFKKEMYPQLKMERQIMNDPSKEKDIRRMNARQKYQLRQVLESGLKSIADEKAADEAWTEQGLLDYFNSGKAVSKDNFVLNNMRAINANDPMSVLIGTRYPYSLSVKQKQKWLDDFNAGINDTTDYIAEARKLLSGIDVSKAHPKDAGDYIPSSNLDMTAVYSDTDKGRYKALDYVKGSYDEEAAERERMLLGKQAENAFREEKGLPLNKKIIALKKKRPAAEPKKKVVVKKKDDTQANILKGLKGE